MILNYRAVIKRIGNFIAEVRKQQNMTQRELAEKIGVSDKTISKWETGKSMPELGYLQQLCETLQINVNELLSGERLSGDDYPRKAEETIMALMKDNETNKKKNIRDMIIGIILAVAAFAFMFAMTQSGNPTYYVDMGSFAVVVLLSGAASASFREKESGRSFKRIKGSSGPGWHGGHIDQLCYDHGDCE